MALLALLTARTAATLVLAASQAGVQPEVERLGSHEERVHALFFVDEGKRLVTATRAGVVRVWNVRSGKLAGEYRHESTLDRIVPCNDGRNVVFVSASTFGMLNGKDAEFEGSTAYPPAVLHGITFVPKFRWLFIGQDEGVLRRFSAGNIADPGDTLGVEAGRVGVLAATADGALVAAGDDAGRILLVEPRKLDVLARLEGHTSALTGLAFAPDGGTLYSSSTDGSLPVWDVKGRAERGRHAGTSPLNALSLDARGERVAFGDEAGAVELRRTKDWEGLARLEPGAGAITSLDFDAKGKLLATPGPEGTVMLWDVAKLR